MIPLNRHRVVLGADPEFFFTKNGHVVASEFVIPKEGIDYHNIYELIKDNQYFFGTDWKVVRDGVQGEMNFSPKTCRQELANAIGSTILGLSMLAKKKGLKLNLGSVTREVSKTHFDKISDDGKKFGCAPSFNIYEKDPISHIKVDPMVYRKRSAGGHIHLGFAVNPNYVSARSIRELKKTFTKLKRLVPMLDIIVGNTLVLLDQDTGNKERRENYGRAGEYRTPSYGVEYRTPSNFWLKDYKLMSFTFALARMAVDIVASSGAPSTVPRGMEAEIRKAVDILDIRKAIDENDYDLAYANFKKIEPIISKYCGHAYPLYLRNLPNFHHFLSKGMDYWFKKDPVESWLDKRLQRTTSSDYGWEMFLGTIVEDDMKKG